MVRIQIIFLLLFITISCGSDDSVNTTGTSGVVGMQALKNSCNSATIVSYAELDSYLWSRRSVLNSVYIGQSKSSIKTSRSLTYTRFGQRISCEMETTRDQTIIRFDKLEIYSLVNERVSTRDNKLECQGLISSRIFVLRERRNLTFLLTNMIRNLNNVNMKMGNLGGVDILCLESLTSFGQGDSVLGFLETTGSLWNGLSEMSRRRYSYEDRQYSTKTESILKQNDRDMRPINIYDYEIISE